jgi:hypothetical protein
MGNFRPSISVFYFRTQSGSYFNECNRLIYVLCHIVKENQMDPRMDRGLLSAS